MTWYCRSMVACSTVLLLVGCAEDAAEYQKRVRESHRQQQEPAPSASARAEARYTARPAAAVPPKPVEPPKPEPPTLDKVLAGRVLVSPWTAVSPIQGTWAWANDPAFVIIFAPDGTLRYGPSVQGVYQLTDAQTLRYQFTVMNGQPLPGQTPQDWRIGFFENGAVLVLMREQQAMLFKRQ